MYRAHTVSVAVAVPPQRAYAYIADPANLPRWASGLVKSIEKRGDDWIAQTTLGQARFRFASFNELGVLDHDVELPAGKFHNPMRVIPNGKGCEVLFTALQVPGISDAQFSGDLELVRRDLGTLRDLLEQLHGSAT